MEADPLAEVYRFDRFTLDLRRGMLFGEDGTEIALRPKSFFMLCTLVENAGQLLGRDALMAAVWPGVFVTDESIAQCVKDVRRALGDEKQRLVRTVVKRGYILMAEVTCKRDIRYAKVTNEPSAGDTAAEGPHVDPGGEWIRDSGSIDRASQLCVVLVPLENLSGNPDDDFLAAAITEDLTTELCRLKGARVVALDPPAAWRASSTTIHQIGRALGVRYAINGSIRRLDNSLHVNVRLIATETNTYLWAGRFDHDLNDVSRALDAIVSRLRIKLVAQIMTASRAARSAGPGGRLGQPVHAP